MSEHFRKIDKDFGGSIQPKCCAFDDQRPVAPISRDLLRLTTGFRTFSCQSFFFNMATTLLSSFFLDLLQGCSPTWRCAQEQIPKFATTLCLVVQAFWRVPLFTKWVIASSSKVILARPSRRSTTGTPASGTLGPRRFSLILLRSRARRRIRLCRFCTLIDIVTETAIVSFRRLPVGFPLPTFSKNSLYTLFCPLDFWPRRFFHNLHFWSQNFYFEFLAQYFSSP